MEETEGDFARAVSISQIEAFESTLKPSCSQVSSSLPLLIAMNSCTAELT